VREGIGSRADRAERAERAQRAVEEGVLWRSLSEGEYSGVRKSPKGEELSFKKQKDLRWHGGDGELKKGEGRLSGVVISSRSSLVKGWE